MFMTGKFGIFVNNYSDILWGIAFYVTLKDLCITEMEQWCKLIISVINPDWSIMDIKSLYDPVKVKYSVSLGAHFMSNSH